MKFKILIALIVTSISLSCNKEDATLNLKIIPTSLDIKSGESVKFSIEGTTDFLVFYSGLEGQKHKEYPDASAESINVQLEAPLLFTKRYNLHGTVNAVFIASSYGNWSNDKLEQIYEFDINVSDNNTDLKFASLKTPGLFGTEYIGEVDTNIGTITVTMPSNSKINKLTTNIVTDSPLANIYLDNKSFENKSQLDFSPSKTKTFLIKSIGGKETKWTMNIVFE